MTETLRTSPSRFAEEVLGMIPHRAQREWMDCRAKIRVACCGRRWGKTFSTAAEMVWFAVMHAGTTQFIVAPTADQSRIIMAYMERMIGESVIGQLVTRAVQSPFPEIRFANGSVIKARSTGNDAANLRGHGADRIVFDEAAFIPAEVYEALSPLLANSQYGELVLISTPFGKNTFWEYWQRGMSGTDGVRAFRYPSSSNPHLSRAYLEQQRRDMTAMAFAVEYEAEFSEDQATVFKHELIAACLADCLAEPESGHRYVLGFDPAKWGDRSAVVVLDVSTSPWLVAHLIDLSGRDYLVQLRHVVEIALRYNDADILMDATSHDQMLEALIAEGLRVEGFKFTNESKAEIIDGLVIVMEQDQLRVPNDHDLIRELSYYRFELTAAGNVRLGAPDKPGHHDDYVSALALAVQQAKVPESGILLSSPRRSTNDLIFPGRRR